MSSTSPAGIFLVEDSPILRAALAQLLDSEPDLAVIGIAATAEEALRTLLEEAAKEPSANHPQPDLVLVDLMLPGMNGLELVRLLQEVRPSLPLLMFSGHATEAYAREALAAGAVGFVAKGDPERLLAAIRRVVQDA